MGSGGASDSVSVRGLRQAAAGFGDARNEVCRVRALLIPLSAWLMEEVIMEPNRWKAWLP